MPLNELLESVGAPSESGRGLEVTGVADASNQVAPGAVFVALRGTRVDARRYVPEAVKRGAVAVVVDDPEGVEAGGARLIVVPNARRALACLAHAWHGHPARAMKVAGVTGTNGKTTIAHYLESIFEAAGLKPGMMGTIEYRAGGVRTPALTTTPSPLAIAAIFAQVALAGGSAVAMEVSAHGIDQARVDGFAFAAAIMTNLSQDHFDYFHDMEIYGQAKRRFFFDRAPGEEPAVAVFNLDDAFSAGLAAEYKRRRITYGLEYPGEVRALAIEAGPDGSTVDLETPAGAARARIALPGRYNILNAMAALAAGLGMGIDLKTAVAGIEALQTVPGRCERIVAGQPFTVIVDYAHTPDAMNAILMEARRLTARRLMVVFGCGGDRDKGKRPLMGEAAKRWCDYIVVTNCNPRTEEPEAIAGAIVQGIQKAGGAEGKDYEVELERRLAFRRAFEMAAEGDIIVLAGRGHEPRQLFAGTSREFDDRVVARETLRELGYGK